MQFDLGERARSCAATGFRLPKRYKSSACITAKCLRAWLSFENLSPPDPSIANTPELSRRNNAACAAALAACGRGDDATDFTDEQHATLRIQARGWLCADLGLWKQADRAPPREREAARKTLSNWRVDRHLAGLRDPDPLWNLPQAERDEGRAIWSEVDCVIGGLQKCP
jgi:hypothetical protein